MRFRTELANPPCPFGRRLSLLLVETAPRVEEGERSVMLQVESDSQPENLLWKSQSAQDAAGILGIDGRSEEVPTSTHVILAAQIKLRQLRRELSARLSNSLQAYQVETGLEAKAGLPLEHVWLRIRSVQSARDRLLLLRRRLFSEET